MKAHRRKIGKGWIWLFILLFSLGSVGWSFLPNPILITFGVGYSTSLLAFPHSHARVTAPVTPTIKPTPTYKACHICGDDIAEPAQVQAVLFWMATCGHCKYVLNDVLPPLEQQYGAQLAITKIEVSTMEDFDRLYQIADLYNIPKENVGVPFLVIGERVLIGSRQIPQELPTLIEDYLAKGGVGIPGKISAILPQPISSPARPSSSQPTPTSDQALTPTTDSAAFTSTPLPAFAVPPDLPPLPEGFYLAAILEIGLLVIFVFSMIRIFHGRLDFNASSKPGWLLLIFIMIGLGSALYLAYVEITAVEAVCGPVGDCNAVQQSQYARLFGILPLGLVGSAAYLVMALVWVQGRSGSAGTARRAGLGLFVMALIGVGFSIYLTYLELFVIRAICAWCLTSALMMGMILLFNPPRQLMAKSSNQIETELT